MNQSEYDFAKRNAKVVANKLGISEQEAEGRIVAEMQRNSDKQTADAAGGKHDYEIRSIVGCQNLNCSGSTTDSQYANHNYNSELIAPNQTAYNLGQTQIGTGLTPSEYRSENIVSERIGKGALALASCTLAGPTLCKAAATGFAITLGANFVLDKPVTTAESLGAMYGGVLGEARGMLPAEGNSGISYMFSATADQKSNPNMYAYSPYYGLQGTENWPSEQNVANSANRDQAIRQLAGAGAIAAPAVSIILLGAPIASAIGGIGIYSAIGATASGGMDAAGQYAQTAQIRPVQSLFAASIGAIATPIGASTRFISNVLLGGAGGAVNTAFNNTYYGDSNSVLYAGGLGALAGAGGYFFGWASTQGVASLSRPMIYPNLNPKIPILFQGVQNPFPGFAGTTAGSIVGGASSFVPGKEVRK